MNPTDLILVCCFARCFARHSPLSTRRSPQKADMASAHSALELDISKRRKEEIKRKEEEITKSREQELEKTKNSFTEENPMPANLSGDFFAETSKIIKEKKDEIKVRMVSTPVFFPRFAHASPRSLAENLCAHYRE